MQLSVIIPTFNRAAVLLKTLQGYADQCGDHRILEVLVVDDGSTDDTAGLVDRARQRYPFPLRYLHQQNRGLAAARNHGFREARGELVLFGDDDIIPSPSMVAEHVAGHRRHPGAAVGIFGHVTWDPSVKPTPFMNWAGHYGPLLTVGLFTPDMELDFKHAVFGNTSVKAAFLKHHGIFDESFIKYGWEDLELSYRLYQHGFRIRYRPAAVGYHHKFLTFEKTLRQIEALYNSWPVFAKTRAGERFLADWRERQPVALGAIRSTVRMTYKAVRPAIMPLLRRLMDTRIRLPHRVYDVVFSYYLTSFADIIAAQDATANKREQLKVIA